MAGCTNYPIDEDMGFCAVSEGESSSTMNTDDLQSKEIIRPYDFDNPTFAT